MKNKIIIYKNGAIIAKLARPSYHNGIFSIDGVEIPNNGKSNIEVVLKSIPKELKFKYKINELIYYKNKDGEMLSIYDYNTKVIELLENCDDNDEFSDIDEEYAYKKFKAEWSEVREEVEKIADLEFSVFECLEIPAEYKDHIFSKYHLPNFEFEHHYVDLNIKPSLIVDKVAKKYRFEKKEDTTWGRENTKGAKYSIGDRLEFMKINANYPFGSDCKRMFQFSLRNLTIEDAIACVDNFEKVVDKAFLKEYNKLNNKKVDFTFVSNKLELIKNQLNGLEVKQKSRYAFSALKNKMHELIEELNEK